MADEIVVMYKGEIVEQGNAKKIFQDPQHPYTKALLACRPSAAKKGKRLSVINDYLEGNDINNMVGIASDNKNKNRVADKNIILSVSHLDVTFPVKKNFLGKTLTEFKAVNDVSFDVYKNETIGLVGESGCGKTTLGRAILQLVKPSSGHILLGGKDIASITNKELIKVRKDLQIVFQDPYGSLNPRITIGNAILEPLAVHHIHDNNKQRREKVIQLMKQVDLIPEHFDRYPHQFSGGQRQRICIARALALNPSFLIFDESVSALDVSVQAQVLNLINDLKAAFDFTSIFISHDLSVVHYISDRILVMRKGVIIEEGFSDEIYFNPRHEYTRQLIAAIPGKNIV